MTRRSVFTPAEQTTVDAYVARLLAIAPPLTDPRRDRLSLLLRRSKVSTAA